MATRHEWLQDPQNLISALRERFEDLESLDLRVGSVFVHRDTAAMIAKFTAPDFESAGGVSRMAFPGYVGDLWGARVVVDPHVVADHVVLAPDDMEVRILGPACGVAL